MINLTKVISSAKTGGYLFVKFLRFGKKDIQDKRVVAPYGVDSNPIADMVAIYARTGQNGDEVLFGYINKNAVANPGELRFFATNADGVEQGFLWFKNDTEIHFNGDEDYMARFNELKTGFDQLKADHNQLVSDWNLLCNTYVPAPGGSPLTLVSLVNPASTASIDDAKIEAIRTSAED